MHEPHPTDRSHCCAPERLERIRRDPRRAMKSKRPSPDSGRVAGAGTVAANPCVHGWPPPRVERRAVGAPRCVCVPRCREERHPRLGEPLGIRLWSMVLPTRPPGPCHHVQRPLTAMGGVLSSSRIARAFRGDPSNVVAWSRIDAMTTEHVCPKCQSRAVTRIPRQDFLERLVLKLRRQRLYRCLHCNYRFHDRRVSRT